MSFRGKRIFTLLIALFIITAGLFVSAHVHAQVNTGLDYGSATGLVTTDIRVVIAKIIRAALGLLGIIAVVIVLYGGFVWMTSGGDEEKITQAKKILINGVIGLAIILFSVAITQFIIGKLLAEGNNQFGEATPANQPAPIERYSGALGAGIIESHYPERGATGIPRNTKIIISFKEAISLPSIIKGYNDHGTALNTADDTVAKNDNSTPANSVDDWMELNSEAIKIYKSIDGVAQALPAKKVRVVFTADLKTFVFSPIDFLGSPSENVYYTVELTKGDKGIKKTNGDLVFSATGDGYSWDFEVSTITDTTPPKVESVVPSASSTNPRNVIVQVNFNEAVDPTTVSGKVADNFRNLEVRSGGTLIQGAFAIGNQYKTVEFITTVKCGVNSCGGDVYCLPSSVTISALVKAATLTASPPTALWPYDGVTDVCGNSLDGNGDGTASGPASDNYSWSFMTNDNIDLIPPVIENTSPAANASGVALDQLIEIRFSKLMSAGTLNTSNVILEDNQPDNLAVWFSIMSNNLDQANNPIINATQVAVKTKVKIQHGKFLPSKSGQSVWYYPNIASGVKDIYQNCFFQPIGPSGGEKCITQPNGANNCSAL